MHHRRLSLLVGILLAIAGTAGARDLCVTFSLQDAGFMGVIKMEYRNDGKVWWGNVDQASYLKGQTYCINDDVPHKGDAGPNRELTLTPIGRGHLYLEKISAGDDADNKKFTSFIGSGSCVAMMGDPAGKSCDGNEVYEAFSLTGSATFKIDTCGEEIAALISCN